MKRRQFLQSTGTLALMGAPGMSLARAARPHPNVLYVFDDQHRAASLPGEPYSPVIAPTLDAFRRANFSMDCCVSNYPLCTPYRGILMTGRWPYQTGIWRNGATIRRDEISLGRVFKDQGYHTAYVGKWHLQQGADFIPAGPDRQGFEDWHVWERTNNHYTSWTFDPDTGTRIQPKGWTPTLMTDQAIDIIKRQSAAKPWMMMVSYNPPHPPYNPPEEDASRYPADSLKLRPNVSFPLRGRSGKGEIKPLTGEDALRQTMIGYYGAITGIDKEFARLLETLEQTGQADNTIVVFTSDHGDMMGSQGRMAKQVPFEESVRVPFFIRYPGVTKPQGKSDTLFAAVDIYPTICGLAGLPIPKHCAGRDLSAVMRDETIADPPEMVFLMNQQPIGPADGDGDGNGGRGGGKASAQRSARLTYINLPNYRGVRTNTHTYAVSDTGRWVLYDNVADPYQMKNLIQDPAQRPLMEKLDALIVAWLDKAKDPFRYADYVKRVSHFPT